MARKKRRRWGHIQTVTPGEKYRIFWPCDKSKDGGRKQPSRVVYGTRKDAETELEKIRVINTGVVDRDIKYDMYWAAVVWPSCSDLEEKTKHGYNRVWTKELEPRIGHISFAFTTYRLVCAVIADIDAPSVQRAAHALWKKICNMAIHDRLIADNPVDRTVRMKKRNKRVKTDIAAEDMLELIYALKETRYQKLVILEAVGGFRHEEACAILDDDISEMELDGKRYACVEISRALVTVAGRRVLKGTKTEGSMRSQLFAEPFASILLDDRKPGALFPGKSPKDEEINESWFANPQHVSRNWRKWCERHGRDYIRFADMRTIYSDRHSEAGSLDSLVQMSMGHDDGTTRGRNYQRMSLKMLAIIASNLAEYLAESCNKM